MSVADDKKSVSYNDQQMRCLMAKKHHLTCLIFAIALLAMYVFMLLGDFLFYSCLVEWAIRVSISQNLGHFSLVRSKS